MEPPSIIVQSAEGEQFSMAARLAGCVQDVRIFKTVCISHHLYRQVFEGA